MNKILCIGIIGLLLAIIAAGIYQFIISGNTTTSRDGRTLIHLNSAERDLVLREMRSFLEHTQKILVALQQKDMQAVAVAARSVGMAAQKDVPAGLIGKLPIGFKKLGFDTHKKFDQLALDAESFSDPDTSLKQLTQLMQNCIACHAVFRLETEKP